MAINATTLSSNLTASDLTMAVASATGASAGRLVRIDNEFTNVLSVSGTQIKLRLRGDQGTKGAAHVAGTAVVFGDAADFPNPGEGEPVSVPPQKMAQVSINADGAITLPEKDTTVIVTKATAAALTLAAPSAGTDGVVLRIMSATAAAHTVTFTAGFYSDTTSSDVATFAAKAGASMTVQSRAGTWAVVALANVTLA